MSKKLSIFLLILILFFCHVSLADNLNIDGNNIGIADMYFKCVMKKDFIGAAKLFHYPPDYSKKQLLKDMDGVKSILKYFEKEFGVILSYRIVENKTGISGVSVFGGDSLYWDKQPQFYKIIYAVQFKKDGEGFVCITFCNLINRIQIRQVDYAFDDLKPGLKERITEVYKGMQKIYEEFQ